MRILDYTRHKLDAAIETIRELRRGEFPQQDTEDALGAIEHLFLSHREELQHFESDDDVKLAAAYCDNVLVHLFVYLPVIGFLHRSKNSGNAFELYGPLKRLARTLVGANAKVIVSSEWDFSPYTLLQMPELPSYVLIGLPASESSNAMLAPLAGHEIGHSIWAVEDGAKTYRQVVSDAVIAIVRLHWPVYGRQVAPHLEDDGDLAGDKQAARALAPAVRYALRQCEEVFCDLVGLGLFGEAYFHAFAYLIAPGLSAQRRADYPTAFQRVEYLKRAALVWAVPIPSNYDTLFVPAPDIDENDDDLIQTISDEATRRLADTLIQHAKKYRDDRGVPLIHESGVESAMRNFGLRVPANAPALAPILIAGWRAFLSEDTESDLPSDSGQRKLALNELMLKSAEILEFMHLKRGGE